MFYERRPGGCKTWMENKWFLLKKSDFWKVSTGYFLDCNPDEVIKKGEKMVKKGEKVAKSVKMWLNLGPWMAHSTL